MKRIALLIGLIGLAALPRSASAAGGAEAELEFFEKRVRPVLATHCYECHGPDAQEAGLRLDSRAAVLQGGDSGAAALAGRVDGSRLVQAIRYTNPNLQMPPEGKLAASEIAALERWIANGMAWPAEPPPAPRRSDGGESAPPAKPHWAFQAVQQVDPPRVSDPAWNSSPIDQFLQARREAIGLPAAPPADRHTLLRRVTFDLTGLPPTPEEIANFLHDDSPQAWARVVDRLLASPAYGERMARRWLDLARFSETNGFNRDPEKPNMYRYRDYVIEAFNNDLPYDQFIREQIAGDLMPPRLTNDGRHIASTIATGMFWSGELVYNPIDPEEQRADQVDGQLDMLGKAFLGLTVACARCHDHKFEPISTRDYYALAGILHSTKGVQRPADARLTGKPAEPAAPRKPLVTPLELEKWLFAAVDKPRLAEVERAAQYMLATAPLLRLGRDDALGQVDAVARQAGLDATIARRWITFAFLRDSDLNPNVGPWIKLVRHPGADFRQAVAEVVALPRPRPLKPINPFTRAVLDDATVDSLEVLAARYQQIMVDVLRQKRYSDPDHKQWLNWFHRPDTPYSAPVFESRLTAEQQGELAGLRSRIAAQGAKAPAMAMASAEADDARYDVYQVRLASFPNAWSLPREMSVGDVPLHVRGRFDNLGDPVPRGVLSALPGSESFAIASGSGRLELAEWIASAENPLTARVMVNRLWQYHFGRGVVASVSNFGLTGDEPTHPELLDWLAAEFVRQGWSLKALHRQIVLSRAYQMAGAATASDEAARLDPENKLWWHMPRRRLDAEEVRDAVLAVSGRLNRAMYGPGVTPPMTPFMYPRFQPKSGPLDGDGRRSVYITVRRNFLSPLLLAFDFPQPSESIGQRDASIQPTQALVMLNNEFVHQQAGVWGTSVAAESDPVDQRIERMFLRGLGRPASRGEMAALSEFLERRRRELSVDAADAQPWTELAHVLLNTQAFLFVR